MRNLLAYLLLFYAIFVLGAPHGIVHWLLHGLCLVFSLVYLHKVTKFYLFWLVLVLCFFCASEPRFSVEYYFIAMGFMSWGMSDWWFKIEKKQKVICFLSIFAVLFLTNFFEIGFAEKGGYLMWFPIFYALYFSPIKNKIFYLSSGILLLFSNKISTLLSYLTIFIQKLKNFSALIIALGILGSAIFIIEGGSWFFEKSISSRSFIWASSIKGFMASPLWGHGFKTFVLDYPEYKIVGRSWATTAFQQIAHGHSLFFNYLFELGVIGLLILLVLFYLVYKRAPKAFAPLLVLSLVDISLSLFGEFLLASLILAPYLMKAKREESKFISFIFSEIPKSFSHYFIIIAYALALNSYLPSAVGHFYYDQKNYNKAIAWDKKHSLYYLVRGIETMGVDLKSSVADFEKTVTLSPGLGYAYGYLAAGQIGLYDFPAAKESIAKAMELSGKNPYWHLIAAIANFKNEKVFTEHFKSAVKLNPQILKQARDPRRTANIYIGGDNSDVRVLSFYRKGPKLFLPLPYIPNCPYNHVLLRRRLLWEDELREQEYQKNLKK